MNATILILARFLSLFKYNSFPRYLDLWMEKYFLFLVTFIYFKRARIFKMTVKKKSLLIFSRRGRKRSYNNRHLKNRIIINLKSLMSFFYLDNNAE